MGYPFDEFGSAILGSDPRQLYIPQNLDLRLAGVDLFLRVSFDGGLPVILATNRGVCPGIYLSARGTHISRCACVVLCIDWAQ